MDIRVKKFRWSEHINTIKMGKSANVSRIKEALENKEIIDTVGGLEFIDPLYKTWLKRVYFKI